MTIASKIGIIVPGPVVNLAAVGAANAVAVFTLPALAGVLVGVKSLIIRKIHLFNNGAGNTQVLIGNGVAGGFVALLPAFDSLNGLMDTYGENTDLIEVESFATITAYPVALGAGTSIDIKLEVLIRG